MPRRTFDMLLTSVGVMLTAFLLLAGVMLMWGSNFANTNVEDQLRAQKIFFPPAGPATESPDIGPFINKYAGQQLLNGQQAEAYANHFIAPHLKNAAGGKTYAEASAASRAAPDDPSLKAAVDTLFRGETLRGLLLNAYAFWKLGQIARIGSLVSLAFAIVMAVLSILGLWHWRRVSGGEKLITT
ncbi:MAG: hypothetical protein WDA27_11595 [Actinomycetota bacterium]